MLIRSERNHYLAQTQSDPLGAYLTNRERAYARSPAPKNTTALASTALSVLGIKYRYGGETPDTGFDCSGLVIYAAEKSLGLKLPRRSADLARLGTSVKRNELKKGDLVFFNTRGHRFSHVGIYLGDRKFVHAPRTGSVVRIESMDIAYWQKRYNGARRLAINTADVLTTR
ncbi:MAG: C40 family peptidase [Pusillimonas sp.]